VQPALPAWDEDEEDGMSSENVYKVVELVGSSPESIEAAIQNAISRASKTLHHIGWFEVQETRGHVVDGQIKHYQVTLKLGFTLDD
jgi:flavin-binding protein dodecin